MDTNYYESDDKSQRRRVIVITTAIALIVLGLASRAIVAIVSGGQQGTADKVTVDDTTKTAAVSENVTETTAPVTEGVTTDGTATSTAAVSTNTSATPATRNTVPNTGPEELLPLALVAGSGVAFAASTKLKKHGLAA